MNASAMSSRRPLRLAGAQDDSGESQVELPDGQFYLSVAPYVSRTHECYYHSLTTCTGELADQIVDVTIVDSAGKTLVDGPARTYANGFVGFAPS